jgi:hypothetical protein
MRCAYYTPRRAPRASRLFGQFGDCQGEHRLDKSDLNFRNIHCSSEVARKGRAQSLLPDSKEALVTESRTACRMRAFASAIFKACCGRKFRNREKMFGADRVQNPGCQLN